MKIPSKLLVSVDALPPCETTQCSRSITTESVGFPDVFSDSTHIQIKIGPIIGFILIWTTFLHRKLCGKASMFDPKMARLHASSAPSSAIECHLNDYLLESLSLYSNSSYRKNV